MFTALRSVNVCMTLALGRGWVSLPLQLLPNAEKSTACYAITHFGSADHLPATFAPKLSGLFVLRACGTILLGAIALALRLFEIDYLGLSVPCSCSCSSKCPWFHSSNVQSPTTSHVRPQLNDSVES